MKWVLPALGMAWAAGVLALFVTEDAPPPIPIVLAFVCIAGLGAIGYWRRLWPVARTVDDAGDHLVVRRGGTVMQVVLADVMNVDQSSTVIRLRMRQPGAYGDEVAFFPRMGWFPDPFSRHPVAEDLLVRVDRARRGEAA